VEVRRDKRETGDGHWAGVSALPVQELSQVSAEPLTRLQLSSAEMNRVLGGGIVPGSVLVIAGDPGIGKSTLLLRIAGDVASEIGQVLYVTGEESMSQVKMRADRLGVSGRGLMLLQATALDDVTSHLDRLKPVLGVVDSIQTVHDDSLASTAGSVAQIRECTRTLMELAKGQGVPLILTGHVTKGGDIAGPRVLEHMVDAVLYMEGDPISSWRLLRAVKNRFGSTNEVGVFEMVDRGLIDVDDPSKTFLSERRDGAVGSVVVSTLGGSRPLLVEVQALTSPSLLPTPRRVATGIDLNRLLLVCAVLTRRAGMSLANQDVVVNVIGGLRISEPAADLGVALAIASSLRNVPVAPGLAAIGEVGLSGEVRRVPQLQRRVDEAARLGLRECLVPDTADQEQKYPEGFVCTPVSTLARALSVSIQDGRRHPLARSGTVPE
jgi:DNA repair protein RadA/Sms